MMMKVNRSRWRKTQTAEERHQRGKRPKPGGFTFSYIPRFLRHHLLNLVDIHPHHLSKQEIIELSKSAGLSISWQYSKVVPPTRALEVLKTSALLSV